MPRSAMFRPRATSIAAIGWRAAARRSSISTAGWKSSPGRSIPAATLPAQESPRLTRSDPHSHRDRWRTAMPTTLPDLAARARRQRRLLLAELAPVVVAVFYVLLLAW